MQEKKPDIIYSEPVREIMGNPPRRILRWGTGVLLSVFVLFILFSWLIRYPDTIPAPVEITTTNPPVTLSTKVTGNIKHLYVEEKEDVKAGQLLAVMETTASMEEINLLRKIVDTIHYPELLVDKNLPRFTGLGELQESYGIFLKNLSALRNYLENDFYGNKISSLTDEIKGIQEYIVRLSVKERLYGENQRLEVRKYRRDSALFANSVIPETELEKSYQSLIRLNIELQQVRLDRSEKSIEMAEKRQLLQDYAIKKVEDGENLINLLNESFLNLKAQTGIWENTYLLISPVDGTVSFTKYWNANQSVVKDEPVITVIPHNTGNYLGRVDLKMQRSGKVKPGQLVNIKLSGYPYLEYGMVRGVIRSKSLVPSRDAYIIDIDLPNGLTTLYGNRLEFTQNMQGTAEIITEDIRLLQKIINPFRYMISRNRR
jgi:multidrug efflux pump subunit AcrA (membrane-fusion protein)